MKSSAHPHPETVLHGQSLVGDEHSMCLTRRLHIVGDKVSPNAVRQTGELQIFPIKYRNAGRLLTCCNQSESVYADDCNSSVSCFFAKRGSSKLVSKCLFSGSIPIKTRLLCTYVFIKLNYCSAATTQLFVSKLSSD